MSLQNLAQHLQGAGRGDDKMLVHMTPKEVAGLQTLAAAHGGSLTINPETGLPEAGFLSSLLPTILGAALAPATGGLSLMGSQALGTAALVGGGYALATGSLQKGLMAGLGAYGGAGLGASLMGAAPAAAAAAAPTAVAPTFAPQALTAAGLPGPATAAATQAASAAPAAFGVQGAPAAALQPTIPTPKVTQGIPPVVAPQAAAPQPSTIATSGKLGDIPSVFGKIGQGVSQMGSGAEELYNDPEKLKKYLLENKYNLLAAGLAANNLNRPEPPREKRYEGSTYDYNRTFSPSAQIPGSSSERTWFAADGGMTVENMSRQNAMMDNQRYPMAMQTTSTYANPSERPISQNVIYPATDASVTPYSGIATLASGGSASGRGMSLGQSAISKFTPQSKSNATVTSSKSNVSTGTATKTSNVATTSTAGKKPSELTPTELLAKVKAEDPKLYKTMQGLSKSSGVSLLNLAALNATTTYAKTPSNVSTAGTTTSNVSTAGGIADIYAAASNAAATGDPLTKFNTAISQGVTTPTGLENLASRLKLTGVSDVTGGSRSDLTSNWDTEIGKQKTELSNLEKDPFIQAALKNKDPEVVKAAQSLIDKEQADVTAATTGKTTSLDAFSNTTKRGSSTISSRGIDTVTEEPTAEYVMDASGQLVKAKPTEKYNPITGKFDAFTGWDTTKKIVEPEDVVRVYEEIVGRAPTDEEKNKYVGKEMSIESLAKEANKSPDVKAARTFTDDELAAEAKYYWGLDKVSTGILTSLRNQNFKNFGQLRDALTANKAYLDHLNELNQAAFTAENTPAAIPASAKEIASIFADELGRKPSASELDRFMNQKVSAADLAGRLRNSNEYYTKYLVSDPSIDADKFIGNLNPWSGMSGLLLGGTGNAATTGTTSNVVTDTSLSNVANVTIGNVLSNAAPGNAIIGSTVGLAPGLQYTPLTAEQLADFKEKYKTYAPSLGNVATTDLTGNVTSQGVLAGLPTANTSSYYNASPIYQPLYMPLPEYSIKGAMQYRPVASELGLENLYTQLGQKLPDLRTGLSFTSGQAQVAGSPFANTTPGLVTLASTATPEKYTAPTPILPGTSTQISALTPQEQALLSLAQKMPQNMAEGGYAGGEYNLGDYSDGGRLLKGPGDGVSDSIPASINDRRPARLADGEFVIPARIVSELGNGSTEAGARQLYAMMDRVQKQRKKSMGKGKVAVDSKANKLLPV